ncbi:hypothetical protein CYLTODRAFT_452861 [Cylindrobasidium torrendii FP15055 ss-10]|uniref:Uncharacterized protein n=1 Tax=Cylindrobasidium torrendii FP15055 ss-10 TaxID=1314674 RepID=A0A0D7BGB1_9AGAR|nr:hypothetical protein CYLTODRAFT_452861 [Cylindrobasidium torrendii FP15055 ss-10]
MHDKAENLINICAAPPQNMHDIPYTLPEEDPFNITPALPSRRHRHRTSLFHQWLSEQQLYATTLEGIPDASAEEDSDRRADAAVSLLQPPAPINPNGSAVTLESYDLVDDDDIPQGLDLLPPPSTPSRSRTSRLFSTPPSIRNLHIGFRQSQISSRPQTPVATTSSPLRPSLLPSRSGSIKGFSTHARSFSAGAASVTPSDSSALPSPVRKRRPSVFGHFPSPSTLSVQPSETAYTPSRPSLSSTNTHTSTTITDLTTPLSKVSFSEPFPEPIRARSMSHGPLLYDWREDGTDVLSEADAVTERASTPGTIVTNGSRKLKKPRSARAPLSTTFCADANLPPTDKPHVAFSSGSKGKSSSMPRVSFPSLSSRSQKKKKLVISGISVYDVKRFDGARQWCETFGEVERIVRMPNGDLHVHFQKAEVADTVCRLRAKVYIAGVGSVDLSWYTGSKR